MNKHGFKSVWYFLFSTIILLTLWESLLEKQIMSLFFDVTAETHDSRHISVNLLSISLFIALAAIVFSVFRLMMKFSSARKLKFALDQYEQLIDTANAPIFGIDSRGYVNEWNQSAEAISGFGKSEVMGRDLVADFITEDYKESVSEVLDKALNGKETANYEFPLYTKDGEQLYVLLNSTTRRDANGKIVGVVGVGQDITELNRVRRENERVANDLTQLIDTANAPIFGIDSRGYVNEWNQSAEAISGYSKSEVMGRDLVADFITEDYKESVSEVLDKALNGKETANYEFPLYTKDGEQLYVLLNSTTRRDANGKIVGVVGVGQDITELNRVRRENERVANDLTQLIDTANAPIFGIDSRGYVNEWNQSAEAISGYSKSEVMGRDLVADFITEDYKESVSEVLDKALNGKETANYEFPLYTKDGEQLYVLLNSTTRRDANGKIVGVVGVGQDITELNRVRRENERVANDLTQLIDTANAPIFGIDSRGYVNEWNQSAEAISGYSKSEVMGRDLVADFITEDYKESVSEVLDKALNGKETANYEFPLYTKDGEQLYVLLNSTTRRDANGKIVGVVGVGQDITELNRVRRENERVANDLTQLIDTANAPIFGIDSRGYVNEWNQSAEAISGYSKSEVMGRDLVADFITEDYKESVSEVLDKALNGAQTANYEFPLYTKGGEQMHVLLNSTTRRDANGKIVGVVGVGQDITALKNIQQEIIQSSKLATLGEMATAVAHELNQPLNTIRFATSNLMDAIEFDNLTQEILKNKLDRIENQVQRASSIIDHMRIFGRATADESPEPVYPCAAVTGAMDLMGEQLRLANINVIKEYSDDKVQILGHSILLEQVVLNLLANARDQFRHNDSTENKEIRLVVRKRAGSEVQIEISDTGGGVPKSVIGRIFEPFYTTKKAGEGTGLGLSLSYGIIRDMGGTLSVRNAEYGAAFIISFPLLEDLAA